MSKLLTPALLAIALAGCASDGGGVDALAGRLDTHLQFLASDAMGGRNAGTVHDTITAAYVASVFRGLGLEPAGDDGTYLAHFPLLASSLDLERAHVRMRAADGTATGFVLEDEAALGGVGGGYDVTADAVFVGYGIVHEASERDDYAGLDVTGKFAVMISGTPEGSSGLGRAAGWRGKRDAARAAGAAGMVVISKPSEEENRTYSWVAHNMAGKSMQLDRGEEAEPGFPRVYLTTDAGAELLVAGGLDLDTAVAGDVRGPLNGVALSAAAPVHSERIMSANVAGLLPGNDPVLKDEVIVLSAHMDHVGINDAGEIHNGADDNASGTSTVMTVAEALVNGPRLKRSVLFLTVSAEEKGLLGSEWWVDHPTVPLESIVANLNMDMVGRNDPDSLGITPSPEHPDFNTLVEQAIALGPAAGLDVGFKAGEGDLERKVDVYYQRSDHANFAKKGIPVAFVFAGEHEDYHQPSDTIEKIDQAKVLKVVDLIRRLVTEVASAPGRPQVLGAQATEEAVAAAAG